MQIQLIGVEDAEGGKGVFDKLAATRVVSTDLEVISKSVAEFSAEFISGLSALRDAAGELSLQTVEVNVELTVKGEVRLIAAAAVETKGSVKLTFGRRP